MRKQSPERERIACCHFGIGERDTWGDGFERLKLCLWCNMAGAVQELSKGGPGYAPSSSPRAWVVVLSCELDPAPRRPSKEDKIPN